MKLARQIERRMEGMLDGLAGRIFRGDPHASELAARLARAAELAEYHTPAGPGTANHYVVGIHPSNAAVATVDLEKELAEAMSQHAAERGWRLEGPVEVRIETNSEVHVGLVQCSATVVPGVLNSWACLRRPNHPDLEIRPNRALIGRSPERDIILREPEISRRHALIYRQDGEAYVIDLASANGTRVDGHPVGTTAVRLQPGSKISFGSIDFRFSVAQ